MTKRRDPPAPVTEGDEGFLARWSRRKHEASAAPDQALRTPDTPRSEAVAPADAQPPSPVTDADLPPLDTLHEDSDYSGFLSPGVSDALRQRALRKLFASNKFQWRDGLDDYDEDYRSFESLGNTITANLRHRMQAEAQRMAQAEPQESAAAQGEPADGEAGADLAESSSAEEVSDGQRSGRDRG